MQQLMTGFNDTGMRGPGPQDDDPDDDEDDDQQSSATSETDLASEFQVKNVGGNYEKLPPWR